MGRTLQPRAEGFSNQRMVVLPRPLLGELSRETRHAGLYPTDVGHFPRAVGHAVQRDVGVEQLVLIYCIAGEGWAESGGTRVSVTPGTLVGLLPHRAHAYGATATHPWTIYWLHAQGTELQEVARSLRLTQGRTTLTVGQDRASVWLFEELITTVTGAVGPGEFALAAAVTRHIVARMALKAWGAGGQVTERAAEPSLSTRLANVLAYLDRELSARVTLAEMAAVAGLSVSHFSAAFRARYGQSPGDFFLRLRMRRAASLLDTTDEPVHRVAQSVGFEDPFHFSRVFRKVYGVPPTVYRVMPKG